MLQPVTGFHQDHENHWVAELICGHGQHMRHDPPWQERPWVTTAEGRSAYLSQTPTPMLNCKRCDEAGIAVAQKVLKACQEAALEAYEQGGLSGLCAEGRFDLAVDAIRAIDLQRLIEEALTASPPSSAKNL